MSVARCSLAVAVGADAVVSLAAGHGAAIAA